MTNPNEVLFKISSNFQDFIGDIDKALRQNLDLLIRSLAFDRAAVFLLDEKEQVLRPGQTRHRYYGETEGEGESYFSAKKGNNFSKALNTGKPVVCSKKSEQSVYIPLIYNEQKLGVLRIDNFFSQKPVNLEQLKSLHGFSRLFTIGIIIR